MEKWKDGPFYKTTQPKGGGLKTHTEEGDGGGRGGLQQHVTEQTK